MTSTTGLSARNIGGVTVHSWCGMGKNDENDEKRFIHKDVIKDIRETTCLITDEISMAGSALLKRVHTITQRARVGKDDPPRGAFGGLQFIFCGDFSQLPPVTDCKPSFEYEHFPTLVFYLHESWRQQHDKGFVDFLNNVRQYQSKAVGPYINKHLTRDLEAGGKDVTYLMYRRDDVQIKNSKCLQSVPGEEYVHFAKDFDRTPPHQEVVVDMKERANNKKIFKEEADACVEEILKLKVNAKVMYLRNKSGLVNGSTGYVLGFLFNWEAVAMMDHPNGDFNSGDFEEVVKGIKLADLSSRNTHLERQKQSYLVPIIRVDKMNHIVFPEFFEFTYGKRLHLPLALGYALTIHKSQGLSLDNDDVNLAGCQVHGIVYVALSRVRTRDGLMVRNFDESTFKRTSTDDVALSVIDMYK